jgi:hypothetical protein
MQRWQGAEDHMANFIAAVRGGDAGALAADVEEGHVSSALCHMGNISHRLGARNGGVELGDFAGVRWFTEAVGRMQAHLQANGVDPGSEPLTMGRVLTIDTVGDRILDDEQASALVRGSHRPPFVVTEEV